MDTWPQSESKPLYTHLAHADNAVKMLSELTPTLYYKSLFLRDVSRGFKSCYVVPFEVIIMVDEPNPLITFLVVLYAILVKK